MYVYSSSLCMYVSVYICVHVSVRAGSSYLCQLEEPRSEDIPRIMSLLSAQILMSNTERKQESWEERLIG